MSEIIVDNKKYEFVVIGMGYVGLTYSLHLNTFGYKVVGIETNVNTIKMINNRILPFYEEGIEGRLNNFVKQGLLKAESPENYKINNNNTSKIYIVTVGTPVQNKKINKDSLNKVFDFLNSVLKDDDAIILRSTVGIGLTREFCDLISKNIYYCFAPERTIEGKATVELATLPQVCGTNDLHSKTFFKTLFNLISSEVYEVSTTESAELVKLTSNVYRDVTFGFSNEISLISNKNGINSKEVIDACNFKYPRCNIYSPGPVAGPCLSKDAYILSDVINESSNSIILSARSLNENYILDILSDLLKDVQNVSILGLSFKGTPPTNDIRDSYALTLSKFLKSKKIFVSAYDPLVFNEDFENHGIERNNTLEDAFKNKDLIIIQNNNQIFKRMDINKLSQLSNKNSVILDLWSLHENLELKNSKYIGI